LSPERVMCFRIATLCFLLLAAPHVVSAQARPAEVGRDGRSNLEADLSRQRAYFEPGTVSSDLGGLLPGGERSVWQLHFLLDGTYTDNVNQEEEGRDAFFSNGSAGLGWSRRSPTLDGRLDYRFTAPVYQSKAVEDRNTKSHAAAAAADWRAARHLTFSGSGDVTQNVETGLERSPAGVRSSFRNRFDEYGARVEYAWQPPGRVSNSGRYLFHYRDYLSGEAEGEDVRRHEAAETFGYRVTERDRFVLALSYAQEEALGIAERRQNTGLSASWVRTLASFLRDPRSSLTVSYLLDRGVVEGAVDYWNHLAKAAYAVALSPRTEAGVETGAHWILPSEGDAFASWVGGVNLSHRFTEHTTGAVAASRSWEYAPATSRSARTTLTEARRVTVDVTSRLARYWDGSLRGSYLQGIPEERVAREPDVRPYRESEAVGVLQVRTRELDTLALDYRWVRRLTDDSDDDFTLHAAALSYRRQFAAWLAGFLRYSHERRDPSGGSPLAGYRENRVYGNIGVTW
jgi:hypothetical protein